MGEGRQWLLDREVPKGRSCAIIVILVPVYRKQLLYILPYLFPTLATVLQERCDCSHFTNDETESQRCKVTCPKWHLRNGGLGIQTQIFIYGLISQIPYVIME